MEPETPPAEPPAVEPPAETVPEVNLEEIATDDGAGDEFLNLENILTEQMEPPPAPAVPPPPAPAEPPPPAAPAEPPASSREPAAAGSIDIEEVQQVIRANMGRIKVCYREGLRENPDLRGEVKVLFTIGLDGRVVSMSIASSTLNNRNVENCILLRFSRMQFPRPQGGPVTIKYPLIFQE